MTSTMDTRSRTSAMSSSRIRPAMPALTPSPQQLLRGDVHPELDQDHPLGDERLLELDDLVVRAHPLLFGGEPLDAFDQYPPVPRPVEDGHPAPTRQHRPETPQEVVPLLVVC